VSLPEPKTFDVRLWVSADPPWPAVEVLLEAVRELAEGFPGIEARWVCERRDRQGRPRIRIHPPPRLTNDAGSGRQEGGAAA
jgi:hypothetical protein